MKILPVNELIKLMGVLSGNWKDKYFRIKAGKTALYSLIILSSAGLLCCKKSANNNPFGNALIATIDYAHTGSILHYHIYYDSGNEVDSITYVGDGTSIGSSGFKDFSYFGTSFNITDQTNFTFTVDAYSNGLIFKILVADTLGMIYNGAQIAELDQFSTTTYYPYHTNTPTDYTWKNGDVNTITTANVTGQYDYDDTKYGQPGDPIRISEFLLYGRSFIKTTHLPTDITKSGVWTEHYFYTFDSHSRISQLMRIFNNNGVSIDDTSTYNYTYY